MMIDNQPDRPAQTSAMKAEIARKGRPIPMGSKLPAAFWLGRKGKPMSDATARKKLMAVQVIVSGQTYPMSTLMADARSRGPSGALVASRLRKGWTIQDALFAFKPKATRKPKCSLAPKLNPALPAGLDEFFIKHGHRDRVDYVSRQFTGRRQLAKLVPQINGALERCKPSKPCMNSSCRKCYGLTRDEERSWATHPKTQAGGAIADALAGFDESELHFVTIMHSHEGFRFDPNAKTSEFQSRMESALHGSDAAASGLMEIQPSLDSGSVGLDFHHHGVIGTRMSRNELRRRLHQVWPESGQVVIKDVDPDLGGCSGIGSYACKERILIPPEVAEVESASEIALQMMLIWSSWKLEDRHIVVGCDRMTMTPVEPKQAHRNAHGDIPPCGGWFMDSADAEQYWERYEEVGEPDHKGFRWLLDDAFEELGDVDYVPIMTDTSDHHDDASCDDFSVKSRVGIFNETRCFHFGYPMYLPSPFLGSQKQSLEAPSRTSGITRSISLPDHGRTISSTIVEDSRKCRSHSEYLDA